MIPLSYSYRNLRVRWKTTLMTASAFTLVVAALVVMLAFVRGVEEACAASGEPENVLLLAKGDNDEVMSRLDHVVASQVENTRGVARDAANRPLASRELFMVLQHQDERTSAYRFLQLRGVLPVAFGVHTVVHVTAGQAFRPNQSEVMIGKAVQRETGFQVGDLLEIGRKRWRISGVFEANGSALEAEAWTDLTELASQFHREGSYSSVVLRASTAEAAAELAERLTHSRSVRVEAMTEAAYYQKQAEGASVMRWAAWVITWFMGVGAMFGVMNTMFAAIVQRTKDIAVLRIIGFEAVHILLSFLLEATLIAVLGGGLGLALGYAANGFTQSTVIGARQIDFSFRIDANIVGFAGVATVVMGVLGGGLPALSAMRIKPLEALR
ncbi:MAG TPA: ABC transporter permease [Gemmataceae bacterium]|nr:ABC transporter permease [Gemmataceae bacterium]